jgi:amino acid permease
MIGSGVLNQPQVFAESGVVGALISLSLCGFFVWVGLVLLVECGNACGKFDYSDLAVLALGFIGEEVVDGLIVLNNFGAVMSYMVIIGGTLSDLFMSWGCSGGGCSVYLTTSLAIILFSMPVCMMRFFGKMSSISLFAVFVIVLTLLVLIISGPIVGSGVLPSAFNPTGMPPASSTSYAQTTKFRTKIRCV